MVLSTEEKRLYLYLTIYPKYSVKGKKNPTRSRKFLGGVGKLISDIKLCKAKNSNRISLNGLLFLLVSTFYLTFQNCNQ